VRHSTLYACADCRARYIDPSLDDASGAAIYETPAALAGVNPYLHGYYSGLERDADRSVTARDYARSLMILARHAPGRRLLDVACGGGRFLEFARRSGWDVSGVDPSREASKVVRERFSIQVAVSRFLEHDAMGARYDAVTMWDFIEHPPRPAEYLAKARALLARDGCLLVATPAVDNLLHGTASALLRLTGGLFSGPARRLCTVEHATYFTESTLLRLLERAGFGLVEKFRTESDLSRYALPLGVRLVVGAFFLANRLVGRPNRVVAVARAG